MFWAGDDAKNRREQITFDRVADVISTPVNSATSSCASRLPPPPPPPHRRVQLLSDARLLLAIARSHAHTSAYDAVLSPFSLV